MIPTRSVDLSEHYDRFVEEQIGAGRYESPSEVLWAGLRLLEQQTQVEDQKLILLQKLASEGFQSLDE